MLRSLWRGWLLGHWHHQTEMNRAHYPRGGAGALLLIFGLFLAATGVFSSFKPHDSLKYLPLIVLTICTVASAMRLRDQRQLPRIFRPARLLLVIALVITLAAALVKTWSQSMEQLEIRAACGENLECRIYERGSFGGTWSDLVVRRNYFGIGYIETPIAQFDRENVISMHFDPQDDHVVLTVAAYGQAPRAVRLAVTP
jgi:uncharacterized membrane protein